MKRGGTADLPLHRGRVPGWLATRMSKLGRAIVEVIVIENGREEVLRRLADPFWFQALGCVMGMDWHSSGITTSVVGALKRSLNPIAHELGIYVCGGRGKQSRKTPLELLEIGNSLGLNANELVRCSKLSAKVDNTAVQDGYQLYLHGFFLSENGDWAVVQQGMNQENGLARRYHWHSPQIQSFTCEPHSGISGISQGHILNLVHQEAIPTQKSILELTVQKPSEIIREARHLSLPRHHEVRIKDVHLKRLGAVLATAHETEQKDFETLLLTPGLGPRTLQSLTMISEIIYGTPSRFKDPARYSFAHGGKDGHPFPVPLKIYDQTIDTMDRVIQATKLQQSEKKDALKSLHTLSKKIEKNFIPDPAKFKGVIEREWANKDKYGGRTVFDDPWEKPQKTNAQLNLFDPSPSINI